MSSSESITVNLAEGYTPSNIQSIVVYSPTGDSEVVVDEVLNGCVIELLNEDDVVLYSTPVITQGKHYNRFDGADISNASFSETPSISAIIEPPTGESDKIQTWDLTTDSISSPSFTNTLVESIDGINWNTSITNKMNKINSVLWNGFRWLIGGEGSDTLAYSLGGNDWTGITESVFDSHVSNISYDSKTPHINIQHPVLACMEDSINTLAYSVDGIRWNGLGNSVFSEYGTNVFWNGYMWVAVGKGSNTIGYSLNLLDWTGLGESIFSIEGKDVHYDKNKWVAVGSGTDHTIGYSYDGFNWRGLGNSIFSVQGNSCYYNGSIWIAVGEGTQHTIAKSTDGITWTGLSNTIFSVRGTCVIFTGKLWLATGSGTNTLAYSEDGTTWVGLGLTIFSTQGNSVSYDDHKLMACGEGTNTIATSQDGGLTWVGNGLQTFSTRGNNIEYNGKWWMACGEGTNSFIYSNNGESWNRSLDSLFSSSWVLSPVTITVDSEYIGPGNSVYKYITSDSSGNGSLFGTINAVRGSTLTIYVVGEYVELVSHPIKITEYNDQGQHMAPLTGVVRTDTGGQNNDGTYNLTWTVPTDTTVNKYQYQCENHAHMRGIINVSSSVVKGISVNKLYRDRYIPNQHYLQHKLVVDVGDSLQSGVTQVDFGYKTNEYNLEVPLNEVSSNIIQLSGNSTITIEKGYPYSEPGVVYPSEYTLLSDGSVNEHVVGSYLLTYSLLDQFGIVIKSISRTVIVEDTVIPIITLLGDLSITVEKDHAYVEPGYTALDYYNEDISNNIIINSNIDISTPGVYNITYDLKDNANNSAIQKTRTITVHDTTLPVITLIGGSYIEIPEGSTYNELGATATDFENVDLTPLITINGNVDTSIGGTYSVRYNVEDLAGNNAIEVIRTVAVGDLTGPVITLVGGTIELFVGDSYVEPGFTAIDFTDGDVSNNVVITNTINNAVVGVYNVKYNVSDVAGNASEATRIVKVKNPPQWNEVGSFVGDLVTNDRLANSALSSDGNIIATSNWMGSSDKRGRIRVYQRNGSSWTQIGQDVIGLTGNVPLVSLSSDGTIFTLPSDSYDTNSVLNVGAVRVFQYNGSSWVQMGQTIKGSNQNDMIGRSRISADGSTLVISSWHNDRSVSVYKYNGSSWIQHGQTLVESGDERYGLITAINSDGSIIAVSAHFADKNGLNRSGTVYVYQDDGSSWVQIGYWEGTINQFQLGYNSIGLSSDGTIISMSGRSDPDAKVRVFKYSNGVWNQLGTDILGPGTSHPSVAGYQNNWFGYNTNLNSDGTIIGISNYYGHNLTGGAPYKIGHLYIYQYDGASWSQIGQTMVGENQDDMMAYSVSLNSSGTVVSVGAMFYDSGGVSSVGKVYVYEYDDGSGSIVDTTAPVITLNGDSSVDIYAGDSYVDEGATATDDIDGDVTSLIVTTSTVNVDISGTYTVKYNVDDLAGNSANEVIRTVNVLPPLPVVEHIYSNDRAFAALKTYGTVVTWGDSSWGGDFSSAEVYLSSGVSVIYSTSSAFAAVKNDGSVVTWGDSTNGGDSSSVSSSLSSGVSAIYPGSSAFAALKNDGSVVTWGKSGDGGDSSSVASSLSSGVSSITSTGLGGFAALKNDGSVVTWGNSSYGGDSSSVSSSLSSGVSVIYSTNYSFAALKNDGSVVVWGSSNYGGNSSSVSSFLTGGVSNIYSTDGAFAALKNDGSVVVWGNNDYGGDSSSVSSFLSSGVSIIYPNSGAFAALKSNGSVTTWGPSTKGGDSSSVSSSLSSGVSVIYYTNSAFAALKTDGSVVTWGDSTNGGNSSSVFEHLTDGVISITSTDRAFAALKNDGSVITWGNSSDGGNSSSIDVFLSGGVSKIFSTGSAFAALKDDGSVVTWGDSSNGGDSLSVAHRLAPENGIIQYYVAGTPSVVPGTSGEDAWTSQGGISADGTRMLVGIYKDPNIGKVLYSHDSGNTWNTSTINNVSGSTLYVRGVHLSDNGIYSLFTHATTNMDVYYSSDGGITYNALSKPGSSYYQTQGIKVNEEGTIAIVTSYVGISGYNVPFFVGYINKDNLSSTSWSNVYKSGWDDCLQFCANSDYSHVFMMMRFGVFTFNNSDTSKLTDTNYWNQSTISSIRNLEADCASSTDNKVIVINAMNSTSNIYFSNDYGDSFYSLHNSNINYSGRRVEVSANGDYIIVWKYQGTNSIYIYHPGDNGDYSQVGVIDNLNSEKKSFCHISNNGTILVQRGINNSNTSNKSWVVKHLPSTYVPPTWFQKGQTINGTSAEDQFGTTVAISGDGTVIAGGAIYNDGNGTSSGQVQIYKFENDSWNVMGSFIYGESSSDHFGITLGLSYDGNIIAIGGHTNDGNGTDSGHVRVYEYNGSSWVKLGGDIDGEASGDRSAVGLGLSSDGTIVAIGAQNNDGNGSNSGHVRVYQYNGSSWTKIGQDIDGEASNDSSGLKTKINSDGTIVAIGAYGNDGNGSNSGHVRVYEYNGSSWVQLGQDINGRASNSYFGYELSLSSDGKTVSAGGYNDNLNGTKSGYAAIYEYNGTSWVQMGSNIHGNSGDWAGWAVALDSTATYLAVGFLQHTSGPGYVKTYEYDGSSWTEFGETITTSTNNDRTGTSVSFDSSGNTLIIGSCQTDYNASNTGSVSVYERI